MSTSVIISPLRVRGGSHMKSDLLSIIIPCFEAEPQFAALFQRAVLCLVGGLYAPLELIILTDPARYDCVDQIVARFDWTKHKVPRIEVETKENYSKCLNRAMRSVSGRYLAFLKPGIVPYEHAYTVLIDALAIGTSGIAVGARHVGEFSLDLSKMHSRKLESASGLRSLPLNRSVIDRERTALPMFDESSAPPYEAFYAEIVGKTSNQTTVDTPLFLEIRH